MNPRTVIDRRDLLQRSAYGLGAIALAQLFAGDGYVDQSSAWGATPTGHHFPPRAKNVIFVFMAGGPSHVDLFDPKPELNRLHGQAVPTTFLETLVDPVIKGGARCFGSPRSFQKYGESGM